MKPSMRCLFETVEGLEEMTNMVRAGGINETGGLLTINFFNKVAMKKNIFDIELVYGPVIREGNGEYDSDGS